MESPDLGMMGLVVEMTIISIEEEYMIVDRGGTTYFGDLGHGLKTPVTIPVAIWCVMDWTVHHTSFGYMDIDGGLKAMTKFSNICGASPVKKIGRAHV